MTCENGTIYHVGNYPIFLCNSSHNWQLRLDAGGHCATIPRVDGCRASAFGDVGYLLSCPRLAGHGMRRRLRALARAGKIDARAIKEAFGVTL